MNFRLYSQYYVLASNLIRKQKPNSRIEEYSGIILYESQKMERNVEDSLSVSEALANRSTTPG